MSKTNKAIFWISFGLVFTLIAYKVFNIPITHDETATTVFYYNFSVWEIMMYPDNWPNNHILNTLLVKFFINVFGKEQWVVRLPNLLSFIVYGFAVYRIMKLFFRENSKLVIAAILILFLNTYFLDFFGLSRGYGMASALAIMAVSFLFSGFFLSNNRDIWLAFLLAILASYANFTLLIFWTAVTVLGFLYMLHSHWKDHKRMAGSIAGIAITSMAYIALIYTPLKKMSSTNQFQYWTSKGFYRDTIYSLVENWQYNGKLAMFLKKETIAIIGVLLVALALVLIVQSALKKGWSWDLLKHPLTLSCTVLCLTCAINIIQCWTTGTPNLSGRTALFYYPLFSILFAGLLVKVEELEKKKLTIVLLIGLSIPTVLHFWDTYNPNAVREWWYDENTLEVLDHLRPIEKDKTISLKTHWLFHPSFHFYTETGKAPWLELFPYDKNIDENSGADYYYAEEQYLPSLESKYIKLRKFGYNRWLLKRKE